MSIFTPFIIVSLMLLNYLLYRKKIYDKKLYITTSIFILIYTIVAISIYYINLHNGFEYGIIYGDLLGNHFCDEYKYYTDANILYNHLKNGEFSSWINKTLPIYEFIDSSGHPSYGNYNSYVILLTILKFIGIHSALDFILIKLFVYIPTAIIIFKLSRLYLNEKKSLITLIIFSALPGYILSNSLLMRDNIILLLSCIVIYYILCKKINLLILIPTILLLIGFRSYLILVFAACLVFTFRNNKKLISKYDLIYLVLILIAIYLISNFNFSLEHSNIFFSYYQITDLQEKFVSLYGSGILGIAKLLILTLIHIIIDPVLINFLTSGNLYFILFSLGNILSSLLSIIFALKYLLLSVKLFNLPNEKYILLMKFTAYFTMLTSFIVMSKDGYIINRIALMWLPLFIIILLIPFNYFYKKRTSS